MPEHVRAVFEHRGSEETDLNLDAGDIIHVLEKDASPGWWRGTNVDGRTGWFPSNYVEPLTSQDAGSLRAHVSGAHGADSEQAETPITQLSKMLADMFPEASGHVSPPKTPRAAASARIDRRCHELLSSEATLCSDLETLIEQLGLLSRDKRWKLRPEHVSLIESTTASAQRVAKVHAGLREKMALFVAAPWQLSHAFRGCADVMVAAHADFQTHCTAVMVVLQKRAGGQVVGDRAVGTASKEEGTLASDLAALQDLLVRPAQRIMKLGLFMDDMAADARQAQRAQEAEGLLESAEVVRGIVTEINGRIRSAQKSQRVRLIAARVRGVPATVRLAEPSSSREFVLDDGSFRERHRAGYRHLYLFSDALLVCKPGENLLGRMGWSHTASEQDLKFKRLIPLAGLEPSDLPWVSEPACSSCSPVTADTPPSPTPESPGSVQALPCFELPDGAGARVAFHHVDRAKVVEWVQAITEVVQKSWETAETHAMTQRAGLQARAPAPSRPPCRRGDDVEKETALTLDGKRLSQYALLTRARTDQHEPRSPASSRIVAGSTRRGGEGTAAHAPTAASIFYF